MRQEDHEFKASLHYMVKSLSQEMLFDTLKNHFKRAEVIIQVRAPAYQ
jgi:hypothetical protein